LHGIKLVFGEFKEEPIFRREDLISIIRHPIYMGALLIYLGVIIFTISILGFFAWLGIIALYHWLAKYEEDLMLKVFGDAYREYQHEVPMWLPRVMKMPAGY